MTDNPKRSQIEMQQLNKAHSHGQIIDPKLRMMLLAQSKYPPLASSTAKQSR